MKRGPNGNDQIVTDATTIVALLTDAPEARVLKRVLGRILVSAVALGEILDQLLANGIAPDQSIRHLEEIGVAFVPFTEVHAVLAYQLSSPPTREEKLGELAAWTTAILAEAAFFSCDPEAGIPPAKVRVSNLADQAA